MYLAPDFVKTRVQHILAGYREVIGIFLVEIARYTPHHFGDVKATVHS
jgi:hypothetical protein